MLASGCVQSSERGAEQVDVAANKVGAELICSLRLELNSSLLVTLEQRKQRKMLVGVKMLELAESMKTNK